MHDIFGDDDDNGTVFRDVITLALCGFVAIVVLLLPHLNPPAQANVVEAVAAPGNVIVEIRWPDGSDADVDLWVQAPGDVPVGYSNKGGAIFNLLRDDLGRVGDPTNQNYEISFSRGLPPGEYTVNAHLYRNPSGRPVEVTMAISSKPNAQSSARPLLTTKLVLRREGEELTGFRFTLDENGRLQAGSAHNLYKPLRSAAQKR
ncbi:MAG TPA: hypothetical protein VHM01_11545 [Alphaproteobacteria bacterium]|nr:hypothetical protein [Alphaproteobacteria bacterium]